MTISTKNDPFLWIHLAGIAIAPLALLVVWIALGSSTPPSFYWLEFAIIATIGILPILGMQLYRPFCIYSFLVLALKPEELTLEQQKILGLFKRKSQKLWNVLIAITLLMILWLIYQWSPLVSPLIPVELPSRLASVLIAAIAFLISNLFIQVPISVITVLLTKPEQLDKITPIPVTDVSREFTLFGIRVKQILPSG